AARDRPHVGDQLARFALLRRRGGGRIGEELLECGDRLAVAMQALLTQADVVEQRRVGMQLAGGLELGERGVEIAVAVERNRLVEVALGLVELAGECGRDQTDAQNDREGAHATSIPELMRSPITIEVIGFGGSNPEPSPQIGACCPTSRRWPRARKHGPLRAARAAADLAHAANVLGIVKTK